MELAASLLIPTESVVWCLMLNASLIKKSLKLHQLLALVELSRQVSNDRLNNPVSSMEIYARQRIFFLVNVTSPSSANSLQSSMQVNSTAMGLVRYHFTFNEISLSCSCFGRTVPLWVWI